MTRTRKSVHDEYLSKFPPEIRRKLVEMRALIKGVVPEAEEVISYGIAGFRVFGKDLVFIAGFKNHVSFFPTSSGIRAFQEEISGYKTSTGTIQFSLDQSLPLSLLKKIVRFRLKEVRALKLVKSKCEKSLMAEFDYSKLDDAFKALSKPAQRALINARLFTPAKVSKKSKAELLDLHGLGPSSIPIIQKALARFGLVLKS